MDFIYGSIYAIKKEYFQECWSLGRFGGGYGLGDALISAEPQDPA